MVTTGNGLNGIGLGSPQPRAAGNSAASQSYATTAQGASAGPVAGSEVEITPAASQLAQLESAVSQAPAVDQGRVDAIRQSLADGSYSSTAQQIAAGLGRSERLLGQLTAEG